MISNQNMTYTSPLKQNFKASLLAQMSNTSSPQVAAVQSPAVQVQPSQQLPQTNPAFVPVATPAAEQYKKALGTSLLMNMMAGVKPAAAPSQVQIIVPVQSVQAVESAPLTNYKNNLRSMFQNNQSVIYAMIPRTFNAKDTDGNGLIEGNEEPGYFTNMVERLDELKTYGINTLHWLPINPPGKIAAKGNAGSVYAPLEYLSIDPELDDPKNPKNVYEEAKDAIKECHKRDIKVMLDLPSCMSVDLYDARPDLRATDAQGNPKTPEGWEDIRMFGPWKDADKRVLNAELLDYHKKFIDMCVDLGVDGIRADVGRAKPPEFWDILTSYARSKDPEFAFLAECYTYEDASPMKNMPADRPEEALMSGFDSYYGQYHIFHAWKANDFHKFIKESMQITHNHDKGKSLIGSFATHDDKSPMANGGADYCMMTNVFQATVPMTNPYMVTGYESGDRYMYEYGKKLVNTTFGELLNNTVYEALTSEMMDAITIAPKLAKLCDGKDKNKTVGELRQDPEYAQVLTVLDKYAKEKFLDQTDKTFNQLLEKTELGYSAINNIKIADKFGNLKQLINSDAKNKKLEELNNSDYKNIIEYFKENPLTKDNIVHYTHHEFVDIFNKSRKPGGENPEIGKHFGYLMNVVRPKYGEVITKGSYIELPVKNNNRDEVIAYARHKDGKTLVTIANHDVNSRQKVKVRVPGLSASQKLEDLSPKYGQGSVWSAENDGIEIDLGPAQAHIFEVDTPNIENAFKPQDVLRQNI